MGALTEEIKSAIEEIKETDILGCITGSCLLDEDFDMWDTAPDIDVFIYGEPAMIHAMMTLENMGFEPGGKDKTTAGEELKRQWLIETGVQKNRQLSTIMYQRGAVNVNLTVKKHNRSVVEVLANFDMTIVMRGFDIPTKYDCDLRTQDGNDTHVAMPNKLKRSLYDHPSRFEVYRCLRQWNRVLKYWDRGFDTRPMARFYLDRIDDVLEAGAIFDTPNDRASFADMAPEFTEMRDIIVQWLEAHDEDKED